MPIEIEPSAIISNNVPLDGPRGVEVENYVTGGAFKFYTNTRKPSRVCEIVVHESVTRTVEDTVRVLSRKANTSGKPYTLGVHLLIDGDGVVTQHGDLALSWQQHYGAPHNEASVGVELVNPYEPRHLKKDLPWKRVITDAPWAHGRSYVLPTPEQVEAFARVIGWLIASKELGFEIPNVWHGYDAKKNRFALSKVSGLDRVKGGVYSHQQIGRHADGSWPLLYAFLRTQRGIPACQAYGLAVKMATGARGYADLSAIGGHVPF